MARRWLDVLTVIVLLLSILSRISQAQSSGWQNVNGLDVALFILSVFFLFYRCYQYRCSCCKNVNDLNVNESHDNESSVNEPDHDEEEQPLLVLSNHDNGQRQVQITGVAVDDNGPNLPDDTNKTDQTTTNTDHTTTNDEEEQALQRESGNNLQPSQQNVTWKSLQETTSTQNKNIWDYYAVDYKSSESSQLGPDKAILDNKDSADGVTEEAKSVNKPVVF